MLFLTLIILVTIVILLFLKDERAGIIELKGETFYVMNIQYFFSF
jgi:hypothetical protein